MEILYSFAVSGSRGDEYSIIVARDAGAISVGCTCQAGQHGGICRHRIALLTGDVSDLIEGDPQDVARAVTLVRETAIGPALDAVVRLTAEADDVARRLKAAKSALAAAMNG